MNKTRLSAVNFIRKSWSKSFNNGIVYKRVGFKCICATISRQYTDLFYKLFTRATESGRATGGCNFRKSYAWRYQNVTEGKYMFFDKKLTKSSELYYLEPGVYPSVTGIVEAMNTLIQERHNHSEDCTTVRVSRRTRKVEIYLANEESGLAFLSTDLVHIFGSNVRNEFGVMLRGKGPHIPEFAYDIVRIHSLMIYTDLVQYNVVGNTRIPWLRCFLFISMLMFGDIITTGQYMNYETFRKLKNRAAAQKFFS